MKSDVAEVCCLFVALAKLAERDPGAAVSLGALFIVALVLLAS